MNYIYNIKVNLKDNLINFYEWEISDKITTLKKVKIFVVNNYDYNNILKMNIKIRKEFIKNIELDNLTCLFTNAVDIVCIKFNIDGTISKISKLDLEEEREVLDEINYKVKTKILYSKINKDNNYKLTTRREESIKNKLLDFLISSKDNTELIDYLYYEWSGKTSSSNKYDELLSSIKNEYSDKHNKLFKIIELINS